MPSPDSYAYLNHTFKLPQVAQLGKLPSQLPGCSRKLSFLLLQQVTSSAVEKFLLLQCSKLPSFHVISSVVENLSFALAVARQVTQLVGYQYSVASGKLFSPAVKFKEKSFCSCNTANYQVISTVEKTYKLFLLLFFYTGPNGTPFHPMPLSKAGGTPRALNLSTRFYAVSYIFDLAVQKFGSIHLVVNLLLLVTTAHFWYLTL